MLNLKNIGSNQTEVRTKAGRGLMSYSTLVAVECDRGVFYAEEKFSVTTSRHINAWLRAIGLEKSDCRALPVAELQEMLGIE